MSSTKVTELHYKVIKVVSLPYRAVPKANVMLTTDSTKRSLSVLNIPTQCTDYQPSTGTRHTNPTSMVLVRPTHSNTITKYTPTHHSHHQDTHRQILIQNTQQHDIPKRPVYSTFAFSPTTTRYKPCNPKTAKAENRSSLPRCA